MMDTRTIDRARATPIDQEVDRRGLKLRGRIERVGPCPICGGTDRFGINAKKGLFNCRGCGAGGDVIALVQFLDGCSFAEAVERLAGADRALGCPGRRHAGVQEISGLPSRKKGGLDAWARIWRESVDPTGTMAESYLRSRALTLPDGVAGDVVRFHHALRRDGETCPGMVCLFRDIHDDEACAIHRTYFSADGRKLDRRMLGRVKGAAIKLDANENVTMGLHIGEGVETSIAAMLAGYRPTWAVGSASGIRKFPLLPGIDAITVLAERNDGGANEGAIAELQERWAGREVLVIEPLIGDDINDAWRGDDA